ncbi:TadE-like protein [Laceyella sediminis]|uniref:TadE-like protein n=1 Tax=Laceyella sediminis TaxID=573074 RepID=A0ABX5EN41_9BACL|nr:TadE family protein [Laceyella sediminis]PRZ13273.1 TadE-like protein [Laceyella sediminis]
MNTRENQGSRKRKGSATLEFITIIPLVFFMCLVVWQFFVAGMAVMETQSLVKEGVRLTASSGKPEKEEARGKKVFPNTEDYHLSSYEVKIKDGQVIAKAKTEIDIVFLPGSSSVSFETKAKSPVIN